MARRRRGAIAARSRQAAVSEAPTPKDLPVLGSVIGEKQQRILSGDFAGSLQAAKRGDFVFVDPPYTVRHNSNGFVKYNQKIFDWKDQIRLRDEVKSAASRGAKLLITNANHPSIVELYDGIGSAATLNRASVISGDSTSRGRYSELVIAIGYEPKEPAVSHGSVAGERRQAY